MSARYQFILLLSTVLVIACQSNKSVDNHENPHKDSTLINTHDTTSDLSHTEASVLFDSKFTYGIDISKYQKHEIDSIRFAKDSLSFIICKATEGNTYTDVQFKSNWTSIKAKGFIRGAYHFYRSNDQAESQATHFLTTIQDLENTDLPPIVDFEEGSIDKNSTMMDIQKGLLDFLQIIHEKSGRLPIIYTDLNTGDHFLNDTAFSHYPLWVANYRKGDAPHQPSAWKDSKWTLWQRTDNYRMDGIQNDFDVFNGSTEDLHRFIKNSLN